MGNPFITTVKVRIAELQAAQAKHARLKSRADDRLARARSRHETEVAEALGVEADAWRSLLSIPGVTPATVAALLQVDESAVTRWVTRAPRSVSTIARRDLPRGDKHRESDPAPEADRVRSPEEAGAISQEEIRACAVDSRLGVAGPAETPRDPRR